MMGCLSIPFIVILVLAGFHFIRTGDIVIAIYMFFIALGTIGAVWENKN